MNLILMVAVGLLQITFAGNPWTEWKITQADPIPVTLAQPSENPVAVPKKVFSFPEFPGVQVKDPTPPTPVDPSTPPTLRPGLLYIVSSDEDFTLKSYPPGLITIRRVQSPLNIYGTFWDEDGEDERTYIQPYLAIVKAVPGKTGDVYLVYTPKVDRGDDAITDMLIRIGAAPQPPPVIPKPDEPKPDEPKPPPVVVDKVKAMVQDITARYSTLPAANKPIIAAGFREAAQQITDNKITTIPQLMKVTSDICLKNLGIDDFLPWAVWKTEVSKALDLNGVVELKDHVKAWNTIADVLEGK